MDLVFGLEIAALAWGAASPFPVSSYSATSGSILSHLVMGRVGGTARPVHFHGDASYPLQKQALELVSVKSHLQFRTFFPDLAESVNPGWPQPHPHAVPAVALLGECSISSECFQVALAACMPRARSRSNREAGATVVRLLCGGCRASWAQAPSAQQDVLFA